MKLAIFTIFIMINLSLIGSISLLKSSEIEVIGAVEFFRHGARAPLVKFKTIKNLYFGAKRSQLTMNGCRQQLLLGRWIRRRYVENKSTNILNRDINPNQIEIISSPLQRTIFSASAHLLGIYPMAIIKLNYLGHPDLKTDDIPPIQDYKITPDDGKEITITVVDDDMDNMFRVNLCRRRSSKVLIKYEVPKQKIFQISKKSLKLAIDNIMKKYGGYFHGIGKHQKNFYSEKTINKMIKFLKPFRYHKGIKLDLTKKTKIVMKKCALNRLYSYRLNDTKCKKLLSSRILHTMSKFFEDKVKGKKRANLLVLSGHDSNLIDIISNLFSKKHLLGLIHQSIKNSERDDAGSFLVPPLASSILLELVRVKSDGKYYVRFIYNGQEYVEGFNLPVKLNQKFNLLDFEDFKKLLLSRVDNEYLTLNCRKKKSKFKLVR